MPNESSKKKRRRDWLPSRNAQIAKEIDSIKTCRLASISPSWISRKARSTSAKWTTAKLKSSMKHCKKFKISIAKRLLVKKSLNRQKMNDRIIWSKMAKEGQAISKELKKSQNKSPKKRSMWYKIELVPKITKSTWLKKWIRFAPHSLPQPKKSRLCRKINLMSSEKVPVNERFDLSIKSFLSLKD